ncbi:PDZ domain-containing protein [Lentibacillus salinarum]|uniref:PDZ domain-containing protein n=1 Tax=Lentibacillus salinarum TaxID=446820 RepID=A0ABW3ZTY1_9BACI
MAEVWFVELANGIGRFFLNPLVYWAILLVIVAGYKRIKKERKRFGLKVFDMFAEWRHTWLISVIFGLLLSIVTIGAGIVFSVEAIILLASVTILLSLSLRFTLLSPSYTIGITFLLIFMAPFVLAYQSALDPGLFESANFTGFSLLLAILLSAEAFLLKRPSRDDTFPDLESGHRGLMIGVHHLKKMTLIPFFILIPTGSITSMAPFWPYFSVNGETYSLMLIPFVVGFDHIVRSELPEKAAARLAKSIHILSLFVLFLAIGSLYIGWLSLAAVVIAIIGREFVSYRHRMADRKMTPFFHRHERGIRVLAVIPGSPADRLGISAGEVISTVNGRKINDMDAFYNALQEGGAFFKLGIIGDNSEVRFVQSALYEADHHELGVITISKPYRDIESLTT